jgi:hypothetical protein
MSVRSGSTWGASFRNLLPFALGAVLLSTTVQADSQPASKQMRSKAAALTAARKMRSAEVEEVKKAITEACSAISTPGGPDEIPGMNKLASMLWSSRVGINVTTPSDEQVIGQMLRDLAGLNYDWAKLDAQAQVAYFQKMVATYKLSADLATAIIKLSAERGNPVLSDLLELPCRFKY